MQAEQNNVFTYGSLMFAKVMEALVKKAYPQTPATLHNYKRKCIKQKVYPGISPEQGNQVTGSVYYGLSQEHLQVLHRFEDTDGENYKAKLFELEVKDGEGTKIVKAYGYEWRHPELLSDKDWDPEYFEKHDIDKFIEHFFK